MSLYTELFGYAEPQLSKSTPGSVVKPRPDSSPLTTHTYNIPANHQTDVTLTLGNSHSPESKYRPLYFAPCTIDGQITLDIKKREEFKGVFVSVLL